MRVQVRFAQVMAGSRMAALQRTVSRHRMLTSAATFGAAAALAAVVRHRRTKRPHSIERKRFLPPLAVHAISGAVGEMMQVACLYPLSTIKVKCQVHSMSTRGVLRQIRGLGSRRAGLASLYTGIGATTLASAVIGAVYLSSFCFFSDQLSSAGSYSKTARRRQSQDALAGTQPALPASAASISSTPQLWGQQCASRPAASQRRQQRHGGGSAPRLASRGPAPGVTAPRAAAPHDAAGSRRRRRAAWRDMDRQPQRGRQRDAGSRMQDAGGRQTGSRTDGDRPGAVVETLAASLASVTTSVIEGPIAMFRNRAQAGAYGSGSMGRSIVAALRQGGVSDLFVGWTGFMLKSLPEDWAELLTYSQIAAARQRAAPGSPLHLLRQLPDEAADLVTGGAAGAASVFFSMPLDCIKTVLDTRHGMPDGGGAQTVRRFWRTGRAMVAADGPGALFRGLAPNLMETVPSAMIYWLTVESVRRALAPYTLEQPSVHAA